MIDSSRYRANGSVPAFDSLIGDWRRSLRTGTEEFKTIRYKRGDVIPAADIEFHFLVLAESRVDITH